jgi:hypothetical protein
MVFYTIHGILMVWLLASASITAELIKVADFGKNPSNAGMHIYVPAKKIEKPAIVVAVSLNIVERYGL